MPISPHLPASIFWIVVNGIFSVTLLYLALGTVRLIRTSILKYLLNLLVMGSMNALGWFQFTVMGNHIGNLLATRKPDPIETPATLFMGSLAGLALYSCYRLVASKFVSKKFFLGVLYLESATNATIFSYGFLHAAYVAKDSLIIPFIVTMIAFAALALLLWKISMFYGTLAYPPIPTVAGNGFYMGSHAETDPATPVPGRVATPAPTTQPEDPDEPKERPELIFWFLVGLSALNILWNMIQKESLTLVWILLGINTITATYASLNAIFTGIFELNEVYVSRRMDEFKFMLTVGLFLLVAVVGNIAMFLWR